MIGYVAVAVLHGVRFIPVLTRWLAIVDSSVGRKILIDMLHGKNLIGAFSQPESIFFNMKDLETLSKQEFINKRKVGQLRLS